MGDVVHSTVRACAVNFDVRRGFRLINAKTGKVNCGFEIPASIWRFEVKDRFPSGRPWPAAPPLSWLALHRRRASVDG
jgi:hypothetical protein